jgi:hypothetical protein
VRYADLVRSQIWSNPLPIVVQYLVGKDGATSMKQETDLPDINSSKVTERMEATAFKLLEQHPEGLRWTDLRTKIEESDLLRFHICAVPLENGCGLRGSSRA